jgi:hypothetical protein
MKAHTTLAACDDFATLTGRDEWPASLLRAR